jgi:hypothetical protein
MGPCRDYINWTLRKIDQKYLESSEMWCQKRLEKINWSDRVRTEEMLQRVKEQKTILPTVKIKKANWIGDILRRNCLLKHFIEGKIKRTVEVTGKRRRRREQLLDDLAEKREHWKLKEEALDRTVWRTSFGRSYGPVIRETT